ncbi:MAG TPA: lipid-A-disaccharide synthase [Planctomycetaceae bacterium]|jgi:lipid-A-disaccharide synthase
MHIFFSVGEPSGDLHAAKLIAEMKRQAPGLECSGFGGPLMKESGCRVLYRLTDLAVMGILPVIPLIFKFIGLSRGASRYLKRRRPDAVVLVDFPGFNWWIARGARKLGIPVFYYLPPQLWAWAPWRVRRMKKFVNHVLSCLPFEVEWYRRRSVDAQFVGHPFFDEVAEKALDAEFIREHSSAKTGAVCTVAVLPGSRNHEIQQNFAIQIRVMQKLHQRLPGVQFVVASYKEAQREVCRRLLAEKAPDLAVSLHVKKTSEIIELADACLMVSGSVSLELLARKTPAVVVYRINRVFYWFSMIMITCQYFSLPNLIAKHPIMPEFAPIDDPRWSIDTMTDILYRWLSDDAAHAKQIAALDRLVAEVATPGATANAAAAILDRLESTSAAPRRAA